MFDSEQTFSTKPTVLLAQKIFEIATAQDFNELCIQIFRHQFNNNLIYSQFCLNLNRTPATVDSVDQIPFLPIQFFKSHAIKTFAGDAEIIFESSGTTGDKTSRHHVKSLKIYLQSAIACFDHFYGPPEKYCILALLPGYAERTNSSLVWMANEFMALNKDGGGGFYLQNEQDLAVKLQENESLQAKTLLLGVSHALLGFAERYPMALQHTAIMETGGMKGQHTEITREQLHAQLKSAFHLKEIHSEYGMTELLSQAYSCGDGHFQTPSWMKVVIRQATDPLALANEGSPGGINIIDLANIHSCSFIATDDLGRVQADGSFEVLGRLDNADIRGCNMLGF